MGSENLGLDIPFKAARDLSGNQYFGVYLSANDTVDLPNSGVLSCVGVLQDKPAAAGRGARVRFLGVTKVRAGDTLAIDDRVTMTATGYFVKASSGLASFGLVKVSAASGYIAEVILGLGQLSPVNSFGAGEAL